LRAVKIVIGVVIAVVCVLAAAVLFLPTDVVENRYSSLADARADRLFERGWLPDILPTSTHDIRTSNDLDLNLSDGEFSFKPVEAAAFVSRVKSYHAAPRQPESIEPLVAEMRRKGFEPYVFVDEDTSWIFFCKAEAGYCEYTTWLHRG
jgi:hypothetical protein